MYFLNCVYSIAYWFSVLYYSTPYLFSARLLSCKDEWDVEIMSCNKLLSCYIYGIEFKLQLNNWVYTEWFNILLGFNVLTFISSMFITFSWNCNIFWWFFFPSVVFVDIFIMNLILWIEGSSSAISFGTLIGILALWFGISVPLTFLGAYVGSFQKVNF